MLLALAFLCEFVGMKMISVRGFFRYDARNKVFFEKLLKIKPLWSDALFELSDSAVVHRRGSICKSTLEAVRGKVSKG